MLLKDLKNKTVPFEVVVDGETIITGKAKLAFQNREFNKIYAEIQSFRYEEATKEQLLEIRRKTTEMMLMRVDSWDLEYEPGKVIPLTIEAMDKYEVEDEILQLVVNAIAEVRHPNLKSGS